MAVVTVMNFGQHAKEITKKCTQTPSNHDATITMRSPETELLNIKEVRATPSEFTAPKPVLNAKTKKNDF